MGKYKSGVDIKRAIIRELGKKECSFRELETKTNTGFSVIKRHCVELEFLKIVEIIKHKENEKNGRPYTTVRLTDIGRRI